MLPPPKELFPTFWTGLRAERFEIRAGLFVQEQENGSPSPGKTPKIGPQTLQTQLCTFITPFFLTLGHLPGVGSEHLTDNTKTSSWGCQTQRWAAAKGSPSSYTGALRSPLLWGIHSFPSRPCSFQQQLKQPKWHCM